MDIALETTVFFADSTSRQVKSRILGKYGAYIGRETESWGNARPRGGCTVESWKNTGVHRVRGRILGKCGTSRQVRGGIFRKCEAQPWWPGLADKSFLLDHDDTRAALGLYQIPDLLAIVI